MNIDTKTFTQNWIDSWNSHDLDRILSHYAEDFEITTPMIKIALGIDSGTLKGKEAIRKYWEKAFEILPNLHFELIDITQSVDSIAVYYKSVFEKKAIEVMFFNESGKITKVIAHYN